jgi:hypothetical protein
MESSSYYRILIILNTILRHTYTHTSHDWRIFYIKQQYFKCSLRALFTLVLIICLLICRAWADENIKKRAFSNIHLQRQLQEWRLNSFSIIFPFHVECFMGHIRMQCDGNFIYCQINFDINDKVHLLLNFY